LEEPASKLRYRDCRLQVQGVLDDSDADLIRDFVRRRRKEIQDCGRFTLDLSGASGMDSVPALLLCKFMSELSRSGVRVTRENFSNALKDQFDTLTRFDSREYEISGRTSFRDMMEFLGGTVGEFAQTLLELSKFFFETIGGFFTIIMHPLKARWSMVFYYMEESGYKAIPIVAVLTWLLGVVLGYQAGYQMRVFGAETFMPSLLGYSITWEIGPMLTAVLVAGRSGSAYAAEIGTMQVREEVDALRVMGFNVFDYLVTPKMLALLCVMPFLVLLANLSGMFGGLLAGSLFLDLPASNYINELGKSLIPLDIIWGMLKSVVYAVIIANVGSFMGMKVRGGASAVGKATTSSVVLSIFMVIIADALLSLLFVHIRPGLSM
ncbi:MAG: MlaE family lipid ABC transporter permease subunit, partial [Candidatus Aegiribacteria sp.]|nr:MlaE family lipid ABC transporter permease subunit [Candidatus Aegiribacteria sp.]MBD3294422.1 MlaE family lipid ABC transporter permease subunit [Candidatus Fermentibacteria bacterium]